MAQIRKIPVQWTGLTGLPGYSVFYSPTATDATASLVAFFNAIKGLVPSSLQWQVPASGDTLDDATGLLTGTWTGAGAGVVGGSGGTVSYAGGVGAWVNWRTNAIVDGRRLRGRTFLAPLTSACFDSSGTIATAQLATLQTAATVLAALGGTVIWSRPVVGGRAGSSSVVVSGDVPDQATALRSRRV